MTTMFPSRRTRFEVLLAAIVLIAGAAPVAAVKMAFETYGLAEGLPNAAIGKIAQDRKGYLWVEAGGHACRYDGATFRDYTAEEKLDWLGSDEDGNIYLGGPKAIWKMAGDERVSFAIRAGLAPPQELLGQWEGHPTFFHSATEGFPGRPGVSRIVGDRLEAFPDPLLPEGGGGWRDVRRVGEWHVHPSGDLYLNSVYPQDPSWVHRLSQGTWHDAAEEAHVPNDARQGLSVRVDGDGAVWFFGHRGSGSGEEPATFRSCRGELVEYSMAKNGHTLTYTGRDADGWFWFSAESIPPEREAFAPSAWKKRTLGVVRTKGDRLEWIVGSPSSKHDEIRDMAVLHGAVWILAPRSLGKYVRGRLEREWRLDSLPNEELADVFEDRESNVWVAVSRWIPPGYQHSTHVFRLSSGDVRVYAEADGLSEKFLKIGGVDERIFAEDRSGAIWFATESALFRIQGRELTRIDEKSGLPGKPEGSAMLEDREGVLWFGTENGLAKLSAPDYVLYAVEDGLTLGRPFRALEDANGSIWVTSGFKLHRLRAGRFEPLAGERARVIRVYGSEKRGALWFFTFEGNRESGRLCRYDGRQVTRFDVPAVLKKLIHEFQAHSDMLEDSRGDLWIAPQGEIDGVARYDGKNVDWLLPSLDFHGAASS